MRVMSIVKVIALASAVALPSVAFAKTKLPPGACAFGKKGVIASGMACSYNCDPKTGWCAQQACWNGQLTQIMSCPTPFCLVKCGG
jgi:hypothetical protein